MSRIGPPTFGNASEGLVPFRGPLPSYDLEPDVHQLTVVSRRGRQARDQAREPNIRFHFSLARCARRPPQVSTIQVKLLVVLVSYVRVSGSRNDRFPLPRRSFIWRWARTQVGGQHSSNRPPPKLSSTSRRHIFARERRARLV